MRGEPEDEALRAERSRLAFARSCLEQMSRAVRELPAQGGDPVSAEYLKAELFRRVQALLDDPETPLFFGRIDRTAPAERFYVGRRHVRDSRGEPVVLDWRAEISRAFYRASAGEPMGLSLRRRFGFAGGVLTGFEDEHLDRGDARDPGSSAIIAAEIERPRVGPMRDIVATIQPDQDELVRADLATTLCIQGAPGTGKTAVGLHRAAYLLYAHREQLRRSRVLVVGPNRSFLRYINDVLPALGEIDVVSLPLPELVGLARVGRTEDPAWARLKGDARMAEVIARAVRSGVRAPAEDLLVVGGTGRRWRIAQWELAELLDRETAGGWPYHVVRRRIGRLVAELVRRRVEAAGGAPDDAAVARLAAGRDVRGWVDAHWPARTATGVVFRLLSDAAHLASCAAGVLSDAEVARLVWARRPAGVRSVRWSVDEAFLVDEAAGALDRPATYGHLVVDEAQDLSEMQCRALARRCETGSATVLGDLAQATAAGAVADWSRILALLGRPDGQLVVLNRGYRVPAAVADFANRLLPSLGVTAAPSAPLRQTEGALRLLPTKELGAAVAAAVARLAAAAGSVGIIGTPGDLADIEADLIRLGIRARPIDQAPVGTISLVPLTLAKGLEFDHVVVVEPAHLAAMPARGLNWLYVALTRAVSTLTVVYAAPLPQQLVGS